MWPRIRISGSLPIQVSAMARATPDYFNLARKANRWGDLSFALGGWSNERKDGTLQSWKPSQEMVSATTKFAIATNRLGDKKEERELEPRAEGSADEEEIRGDLQDSSAEEDHDM